MCKSTLVKTWLSFALLFIAGSAFAQSANLSITNTDNPDPVPAGSNLSYQIGIVNAGPATAQNVVLNDVLPIGPTFVSATFTGGSVLGTCTTPAVGATGGTFNCTFPTLTNGQSSNYNIIVAVPAGSTGSISNTATVTSDTSDPDTTDNSATAGTAINSNADLSIDMTDSPDPVPAGSNLMYQIGIVNAGPATAQNVVLNDVLPTGPTFVSATFTGGSVLGTCTTPAVGATGGTFNCTFPALTNGQSSNYNITLAVPAGSSGSISNTATVASATNDPTPANNSATASTAINSNADLSITETDNPDPVPAGSNLMYQIGIVNSGPATAQNVVLNDVLPTGPTFVSATFTGGSVQGTTCTTPAVGATGGTFNCTFLALTNGQSSNYNITLAVPAGSTGNLSNTATVTSGTSDPDPTNNSATASTAINSNADLSITMTDSPDPVPAGSNLSYQIGIVNAGPATAQNVVLNDVLPTGPTFVSATFTGGAVLGTCTTPAVGATGGTFNCTYPTLTNGQSSNYNIIVAVPSGSTGSISNTATVTSATNDPAPANNSATASTAVLSVVNLTSAVSRKVHGSAGTFDLPLSLLTTNPTTEPRQGPNQTVVLTFDKPIASVTIAVTEGAATAAAPTFSGNDVIVGLTGVTDQQYVTLSLTNVAGSDGSTGISSSVRVGFLLGDVNQNRVVTVADLGLVNAQLAQLVTAANYLKDVNASGTLTVADKGITNANLTRALPAP